MESPSMYWRSNFRTSDLPGIPAPSHASTASLALRLHGCIKQVRHQAAFELREETGNIDRFLIIRPRHPVRSAAMQTAVAGQQAKCQPAFEDMGRSRVLEAADIMAPEAEAGQAERQAAAQTFCH